MMEALLYVVLVAVGVNLCAVLLRSSTQMSALNVLAMDRLNDLVELEAAVTESIQEAVGVAEAAGAYKNSDLGRLQSTRPHSRTRIRRSHRNLCAANGSTRKRASFERSARQVCSPFG